MQANTLFITAAVFLSLIVPAAGYAQTKDEGFQITSGSHVLSVRPQSPDEAYSYLGSVINQMDFFRLGHLLPGYQLQAQGVEALDPFVQETPLSELSEALERYRNR